MTELKISYFAVFIARREIIKTPCKGGRDRSYQDADSQMQTTQTMQPMSPLFMLCWFDGTF